MGTSYNHALSASVKYGGEVEDYITIETWLDESKSHIANFRHRALRHHSEGIFMAERIFGVVITNSEGRKITVREICELHIMEDCGFIPTVFDWLSCIRPESWMRGVGVKKEYFGNLLKDKNEEIKIK